MFARRLWDTLSSLAIPRKVEDAYGKDQNTVITETVAIDSATFGSSSIKRIVDNRAAISESHGYRIVIENVGKTKGRNERPLRN